MDPRCRIQLLGPLRVVQGDRQHIRFATQKAAALLAYLALRPGLHSREQIIDLFWSDMDLPEGRNNLSTALSGLRRLLEPPGVRKGAVLMTSHAQIGFDPAAITTDVAEFEQSCDAANHVEDIERRAALLERAVSLYTGDFQPGNYQDWAVQESERLQARLLGALERLQEAWETLERYPQALEVARRHLSHDPFSEKAHLALIRCLVQSGQSVAAQEAADSLEQFSRREFGSGPSAATRRAVEALLGTAHTGHSHVAAPKTRPEPPPKAKRPEEPAPPPADASTSPSPIPFWLNRFFGRETEMTRMAALFLPPKSALTGPELPPRPSRLVTLTGPGGMGKTRLAAEFARQLSESLGYGCGFAACADLSAPDQLLAHIAQSLRLPPSDTPADRIAAFFQQQDGPARSPWILVLDNLEQLLAMPGKPTVAKIVQDLLERSPGLSLLCTSRRPLRLHCEQILPVGPMPVPEPPAPPERLASVPSVRLYLDRAQAIRPDFGLTPVNAPAVAGLCQALEGSPLALELAASWVRLLPPRKMWERMQQGTGLPEGRYADLPARHRSLEAALEWSWRLLTPEEQRRLAELSVFRGGWTLEAAEAVCREPRALELLASLVEGSLVETQEESKTREEGETGLRYRLLETVRAFSRQKLTAEGTVEALAERHAVFFGKLAAQAAPELRGPRQTLWLDALEADLDNLRAALDWSVSQAKSMENGLRLASALVPFWRARGYLREGRERCLALLSLSDAAGPTIARADALNGTGELTVLLAEYGQAETVYGEALRLSQELEYLPGEADALLGLGTVHYWCQDYTTAARRLEESLALRQTRAGEWRTAHHRHWGEAATYHTLGNLAMRRGEYAEALPFFEQALALRRRQGDRLGTAGTLGGLGQAALAQGDWDRASHHCLEALHLFDEAGQRWTAALCLSDLSHIAEARADIAQAVRLLAAAATLRARYHFPIPPAEQAGHKERLDSLRVRLGTAAFDSTWAEGSSLSWEQMIALASIFQTQDSHTHSMNTSARA